MRRRLLGNRRGTQSGETYIGGVALTIPDAQTLATMLNTTAYPVTVSDITEFAIVGNNIECSVNVDYNLKSNVFFNNKAITYYKDEGGKVKKIDTSAFYLASNLSEINFPKCLIINANSFRDVKLCSVFDFPELTAVQGDGCFAGTVPSLVNIPKATQIGNTTANNFVFLGTTMTSATIKANSILATNNNGGMDGDLVDAQSRGATIIFV